MEVKFKDLLVCKERRFSIGLEEQSGKYYVSIPVSNGLVDYEEYYEIDKNSFDLYQADTESALPFVERCRERKADELLMIKPGKNRGVPV